MKCSGGIYSSVGFTFALAVSILNESLPLKSKKLSNVRTEFNLEIRFVHIDAALGNWELVTGGAQTLLREIVPECFR